MAGTQTPGRSNNRRCARWRAGRLTVLQAGGGLVAEPALDAFQCRTMGSSITPMALGSPIMQVGFHLSGDAPLDAAAARGVDCVQFFLSDPQSWRTPPPRDDADALRAADMPLYVHAPYLVNVASPNNRIRVPSRRILQDTCEAAATVGAVAVIVHGGHVGDDTDFADGVDNWRKALERVETDVPIYIENTAGGDNAMARTLDAIERLWAGLDGLDVGFCFDTCHAHAAGEDLVDAVARVQAAVGRIDLVHANDSRDPSGSGRDRHESLGRGEIPPDALAAAIAAAGAPVICETPGDVDDHLADLAWLREHVTPALGSAAAAG